ncbi:hypothetical protein ACTM43_21780, partial [Citrobacter freundii]
SFGFAENTDDLFVGKTLLHGDVLMWLMKTLLTSGCTNQRGAGKNRLITLIRYNSCFHPFFSTDAVLIYFFIAELSVTDLFLGIIYPFFKRDAL